MGGQHQQGADQSPPLVPRTPLDGHMQNTMGDDLNTVTGTGNPEDSALSRYLLGPGNRHAGHAKVVD